MPIRCHLFWGMADHIDGVLEKALSRLRIPLLVHQGIHQIAIAVDRSIEGAPFSMDFQGGFVHIPGGSDLAASLDPQLICDQWSKPRFPISNSFMGKEKTALSKYLGDVS